MDNANKAIMVGVGLFITIIVISAVLLIVNLGRNAVNEGTNQLNGISDSMKTLVTSNYAGKKLKGTEVIAAIKQFENENMMIVIRYKNQTGTAYNNEATGNYYPYKTDAAYWSDYNNFGKGIIVSTTYKIKGDPTAIKELPSTWKITPATYLQFGNRTFYSTIIVDDDEGNIRGVMFVESM